MCQTCPTIERISMNAKEAIRVLKSGVPYYAFDVANVIRFIEEQDKKIEKPRTIHVKPGDRIISPDGTEATFVKWGLV